MSIRLAKTSRDIEVNSLVILGASARGQDHPPQSLIISARSPAEAQRSAPACARSVAAPGVVVNGRREQVV
jgi:hypothetical protein